MKIIIIISVYRERIYPHIHIKKSNDLLIIIGRVNFHFHAFRICMCMCVCVSAYSYIHMICATQPPIKQCWLCFFSFIHEIIIGSQSCICQDFHHQNRDKCSNILIMIMKTKIKKKWFRAGIKSLAAVDNDAQVLDWT